MSFKICMFQTSPSFEALPVAKIIHYPLEKRDYKPFAQCRACTSPQGLVLRMWAFEAIPPEDSRLTAIFSFFPELGDRRIELTLDCAHGPSAFVRENGTRKAFAEWGLPAPLYANFGGEDEQGVYWGGTLTLPHESIGKLYAGRTLSAGQAVLGNFYKLCENPDHLHYGSFHPVDFTAPDPMLPPFLTEMQLVNY